MQPMSQPPRELEEARALMHARRFAEARLRLERIVAAAPHWLQAHWLLGGACVQLGDLSAAERAFRAILALDPRWTPAYVALGELLARGPRQQEALAALRQAHALDPGFPRAVAALAHYLREHGQAAEALALLDDAARRGVADAELSIERGYALQALRCADDALASFRRAAAQAPASAAAARHLGAALLAAHRYAEAGDAFRDAIAKGEDTPELWLALAHARVGHDAFAAAEAACLEALRRHPGHAEAHQRLAEVRWLCSGDLAAATAALDAALAARPEAVDLLALKSALHAAAGDEAGAYALAADAAARRADDAGLQIGAAHAALRVDAARAVAHAERALALAPRHPAAIAALADAQLAAGRADLAERCAAQVLATQPYDQHMLAVRATAWRLLGDARYRALYDYATLVRARPIDTPPGWPDLAAYLADLAASLRRLHVTRAHPLDQSLRHGSQTTHDLARADDPAIRAFFAAIDGPIREHIAALGAGDDPVRARRRDGYRLNGSWSVQLRPGGYHTDHIHELGWLSSACYIDLPPGMGERDREGWLRFGKPGLPTSPALEAEHYARPEPGLLALFPSYMWHGTQPFGGTRTRLTIAFDVVPA
ncbi:putative 2OG-Fe(II) oxygenase [Mizugakiibacter sediminis]|nr:putative 2OG-Fe(II) oxygenase [Mizugakiibacter sediminis]